MKLGSTTKMMMIAGLLTSQLRAAETPSNGERAAGDIDGRLLLGVQTRVAQASASTGTEDNGTTTTERNANTMELSVGATPLSVVLGYGLHRDWLLSASFAARRSSFDIEEETQNDTDLTAEAAVSYLLGQGVVRPYVGAQAHVLTASGRQVDSFGVGGGAHAGVRIELADALSLEPHLAAGYSRTSAHYGIDSLQVDLDGQSVLGSFGLRFAGWL
jgi:hypothetical protein